MIEILLATDNATLSSLNQFTGRSEFIDGLTGFLRPTRW